MFFDSWQGLLRVVAVGVPAYIALVVLLRATGKRTLSKMNAFDLVVTVALGSTLASILTSRGVALAEGVAALALLILLQFVVAWAAARSRLVDRAVKSEPVLVFYRGQFLRETMRRERVTESEVHAAIRASHVPRVEHVHAVALETAGEFSVIPTDPGDERAPALHGVRLPPELDDRRPSPEAPQPSGRVSGST